MNPAFFTLGIVMTHLVPSSTLAGTPLSGASKMSFNTLVDSLILSFSLSPAAQTGVRTAQIMQTIISNFISNLIVDGAENEPQFHPSDSRSISEERLLFDSRK